MMAKMQNMFVVFHLDSSVSKCPIFRDGWHKAVFPQALEIMENLEND